MTRIGKQPPRHRFLVNPYENERFDFCPECDGPTEQRKLPLVIHVNPKNPVCINKTCPYCPHCDLLIAHQDEVEAQLAVLFEKREPALIGNDYLVLGTLDEEVWARGQHTPLSILEMMDHLHDFEEVLRIRPAETERTSRQRQPRQRPDQPPHRARKPQAPVTGSKRTPGRNDPCWCGSGKKYKHCHSRHDTK